MFAKDPGPCSVADHGPRCVFHIQGKSLWRLQWGLGLFCIAMQVTLIYKLAQIDGSKSYLNKRSKVVWRAQSCVFALVIYRHPVHTLHSKAKSSDVATLLRENKTGGRDQIGPGGQMFEPENQPNGARVPDVTMCKKIWVLLHDAI